MSIAANNNHNVITFDISRIPEYCYPYGKVSIDCNYGNLPTMSTGILWKQVETMSNGR